MEVIDLIQKILVLDKGNCFSSLRPSDAYMHRYFIHRWFRWWLDTWSAPSHYLNQHWNIVNWTLRNKLQWNFNWNSYTFIKKNAFENVVWKMVAILSRPQCVNSLQSHHMNTMESWTTGRYYVTPSLIGWAPYPEWSLSLLWTVEQAWTKDEQLPWWVKCKLIA